MWLRVIKGHELMRTGPVVRAYMRPKVAGRHSIERVFATIVRHLPPDIEAQLVVLSGRTRGPMARIQLLIKAFNRTPAVHHVTGDIHFLVFVLPWRRTVLTVHDLIHLGELRGLRSYLYRMIWFVLPCKFAAAITVVSERTKEDLLNQFPQVAPKVSVIRNPLPDGLEAPCQHDHRSDTPVLLQVGTGKNKNLEFSIAIARRVGAELSILGRLGPGQEQALNESGVTFRLHHDVADEELRCIYSSASVLLFASFEEGFGMPIIEAQACGLPVITSNREPMRSVAGGAAVLVDPDDADAGYEAVSRILTDSRLREMLKAEGFRNAARHHPAAVAEEYAAVYRALA